MRKSVNNCPAPHTLLVTTTTISIIIFFIVLLKHIMNKILKQNQIDSLMVLRSTVWVSHVVRSSCGRKKKKTSSSQKTERPSRKVLVSTEPKRPNPLRHQIFQKGETSIIGAVKNHDHTRTYRTNILVDHVCLAGEVETEEGGGTGK